MRIPTLGLAALAVTTAACAFPGQGGGSGQGALSEGDELGEGYEERDPVDDEDGCTLTQGYWKNHYEGAGQDGSNRDRAWPIDEDTELCGRTWLDTLDVEPRGDAFFILAHQSIAASLNVAAGAAAPADVSAALDEAFGLMEDCAIAEGERARAVELAGLLDDFNNGRVGPGHCGDGEEPGCEGELCQPPADDEPDCSTELCGSTDDSDTEDGGDDTTDDGDETGTGDTELPPFG
jgi:hypothetical protein